MTTEATETTGTTHELAPWCEELVDELTEACQDPDIQARLPVPVPYTRRDAEAFVRVVAPSFARDGGANFAVLDGDGRLSGCVSVRALGDGRARLGYWVAPAARGRGVAVEAAVMASRWAFAHGFDAVVLTIGADNPASQKVAARAGFREVGRRHDYEISPGMVKDTVLFERWRDEAARSSAPAASTAATWPEK